MGITLGDLVKVRTLIGGIWHERHAIVAEVKKDAHDAELYALHLLQSDLEVLAEADAAKDDDGKTVGQHVVPVTSTTTDTAASPTIVPPLVDVNTGDTEPESNTEQ